MRSLIALFVIGGAVLAAEPPAVKTALRPLEARTPAPDFALASADGATITLSRYKGRVVLLDFWATWCTGCKVEIPWYQEFQKKYAPRGLTSIGAAMDDEGWAKVEPYLREHPINYPIVIGNPSLVKPYKVDNMPVTLLLDRQGKVADWHVGMVDKDAWEMEIQQLLAEKF
jgi:cytochrome c biogenesis protein CcmG/thiol:disulfide interchange protein DsbE